MVFRSSDLTTLGSPRCCIEVSSYAYIGVHSCALVGALACYCVPAILACCNVNFISLIIFWTLFQIFCLLKFLIFFGTPYKLIIIIIIILLRLSHVISLFSYLLRFSLTYCLDTYYFTYCLDNYYFTFIITDLTWNFFQFILLSHTALIFCHDKINDHWRIEETYFIF